jgi:hypothetical protein
MGDGIRVGGQQLVYRHTFGLADDVPEGYIDPGPQTQRAVPGSAAGELLHIKGVLAEEIRLGTDKELKFYIDLFKAWKFWPDEFVLGKYFQKTMKSDPIKKEYAAASSDGSVIIHKRFNSLENMFEWTLSFKELKLSNIRELEPGQYFIRITVESKKRKLPPVIGYLLVFLPENEFRISKDSAFFSIEGSR